MEADPLVGCAETEKIEPSVSPSVSDADTVPESVVSSLPVIDKSPEKVAASSTAETEREIVCTVVPPRSSVMVTPNESAPL